MYTDTTGLVTGIIRKRSLLRGYVGGHLVCPNSLRLSKRALAIG